MKRKCLYGDIASSMTENNEPIVCILAPVHIYNDIRVFQKEAITLAENGYKVILYAQSEETYLYRNISIISTSYRNRFERFCNIPKLMWRVLHIKADVFHLHNPDMLPVGIILKLFGRTVIYDTHEDFKKRILIKYWIPRFLRKLIAHLIVILEKVAGRIFDYVIVTQEEVRDRIGGSALIILNSPIITGKLIEEAYSISKTIEKDPFFRVIYVGGISRSRGLDQMAQAVSILNQYLPARLWLCGHVEINADLEKIMNSPEGKYVDYLGVLNQSMAYAYLIKADVGLITIQDVGDYSQTSPNKLYEYMLFHLPFVASNFLKWQHQLHDIAAGIFVNPDSPENISKALYKIAQNPDEANQMASRGNQYIATANNWTIESAKLLALYKKLL